MSSTITIPKITNPNTGIYKTKEGFCVWWRENGVKEYLYLPKKVTSFDEAHEYRDAFYATLKPH